MKTDGVRHRELIQEALTAFSKGNVESNCLVLLNVLGYQSKKKTKINFDSLKRRADERGVDQSRFDEIKTAELIFQLTDDEIKSGDGLFNTIDTDLIQSYLFFAVELKQNDYPRGRLSDITRLINRLFDMPVMVFFRYGKFLTLSMINRRESKRGTNKDVLEKVTLIKDINIANPHRAHIEILFDLSFDELKDKFQFTDFVELHNAWQKTLDTKELNKRFFSELANWYFWAMDNVQFPDDIEKKKDIRNATNLIRLITRVIFIWFIKEKKLVPDNLFREEFLNKYLKDFNKCKTSEKYYHAILQNLFFGTLNQKMNERGFVKEGNFQQNKTEYGVKNLFRYADKFSVNEKQAMELFKDVPFLNGGLFDCLDKPNEAGTILYVDGFSRNTKKQAHIPDYLFFGSEQDVDLNEIYGTRNKNYKAKGLVNLLESYKFTVAENTPIEEEIALDPELLGKVFENLLASYNPETQTTARKQTGSFYTPREIVNYMVDESLIEYLKSAISIPADGESNNSIPADGIQTNISDNVDTFFNPQNEIEIHQGNLPHWQQNDVWYFITFRLADSIPKERVEQLKVERDEWLKKHNKGEKKEFSKEDKREYYKLFSKRVEEWLNAGKGSCVLKEERVAKIVADSLLHFNNQRYVLDEWVIMPNHVHVLVKPLGEYKLPDILHSWKSFSANKINEVLGNKGQLWMHESYDHIVRNEKALNAIRNYIRNNPAKAGINVTEASVLRDASSPNKSKDAFDTKLRDLFSYSENPNPFNESETKVLIEAINNCKILDPACGSGAFPMGVLHKMVHILTKLDNENILWRELQKKKAIEETEAAFKIGDKEEREKRLIEINDVFENNASDYGRKLYLIENCIYGIDIQPIAVQIAKLRFFISLVIDQNVLPASSGKENRGVKPLPNLETKFVAANTLIGLDKPEQTLLRNLQIEEKEKQLKELRHNYFTAKTRRDKIRLRDADKTLRKEIAKMLEDDGWNTTVAKQIVAFDPYDQNIFANWFDKEWMFGTDVKDGFDVVIGNPPYGLEFSRVEKRYLIAHYHSTKTIRDVQKGSMDSFTIFIEEGFNCLRQNGNLQYIVPISISSSDSMTGLHRLLEANCRIIKVSSYAVRPQPVFENAVVNTSILFFEKTSSPVEQILCTKMHRKTNEIDLEHLVNNLKFIDVKEFKLDGRYPKVSLPIEQSILRKIFAVDIKVGSLMKENGKTIYYRTTGGRYFKIITNYSTGSTKEKPIRFDRSTADIIGAVLSSNLFFWFYQIYSNNLDLKSYEIESFRIPIDKMNDSMKTKIEDIYEKYLKDIERNVNTRQTTRYANIDSFKEYKIGKSKHLIDQIDDLIFPLYELTDEENNFIKNYEIEFRIQDAD